jgi:hypothetical protein
VTNHPEEATRGWCSLRLRFEERELVLLRGAEQVRGVALAQQGRPDVLRSALGLAKAGQKLRHAVAGPSLIFDENELRLLIEAVRFAHAEVQWAARQQAASADGRAQVVLAAFPELAERGLWRSFGLTRELDEVAQRLERALRSM